MKNNLVFKICIIVIILGMCGFIGYKALSNKTNGEEYLYDGKAGEITYIVEDKDNGYSLKSEVGPADKVVNKYTCVNYGCKVFGVYEDTYNNFIRLIVYDGNYFTHDVYLNSSEVKDNKLNIENKKYDSISFMLNRLGDIIGYKLSSNEYYIENDKSKIFKLGEGNEFYSTSFKEELLKHGDDESLSDYIEDNGYLFYSVYNNGDITEIGLVNMNNEKVFNIGHKVWHLEDTLNINARLVGNEVCYFVTSADVYQTLYDIYDGNLNHIYENISGESVVYDVFEDKIVYEKDNSFVVYSTSDNKVVYTSNKFDKIYAISHGYVAASNGKTVDLYDIKGTFITKILDVSANDSIYSRSSGWDTIDGKEGFWLFVSRENSNGGSSEYSYYFNPETDTVEILDRDFDV